MATTTMSEAQHHEMARWTHTWMAAAVMLQTEVMPQQRDLGALGRDLSGLLLVQAARNAYRGAVRLLGKDSSDIEVFEARQPDMRDLRDRLEHFDDYVLGWGKAQTASKVLVRDRAGLRQTQSSGSADSHAFTVECEEGAADASPRQLSIDTYTLIRDLRSLISAALSSTTLEHPEPCHVCGPCM